MNVSQSNINNPSTLIINGDRKYKQISFTYDSGFDDNETSDILDVLRKHDLKATFPDSW